jgi:hypothetical protein
MFCKNFSIIAAPLFRLTKKDTPFVWGKEQQDAQETIITLIMNAPVLVRPDPSRQFELKTDALLIGTGAILYQRDPPSRWHAKTRTTTPLRFPFPKFHLNQAKLPDL